MTTFYQNNSIENSEPNLWEAFLDYLSTAYFPGAEDSLESELISHEYRNFLAAHS